VSGLATAQSIRDGSVKAEAVVESTLAAIARINPQLNAFVSVTADRARSEAKAVDKARSAGQALAPLAGVPYAVKNLFDVAGLATLAGSKINASHPPAKADAALVSRMKAAGAVLVGTLNMDEFAYGFTTENTHPSASPADPRAAPAPRPPRGSCPSHLPPTPTARSACPRHCAACGG
jgi:Asp-tRNA(Asn)/Glu-tRNA(Gln) amidotransferase A subunit family amidase